MAEGESMVFVDASPGEEESIEVVNENTDEADIIAADITRQLAVDTTKEGIAHRQDIAQAEVLPTKTKGGLFYNTQDGLNEGKSMVKSKPRIDERIQECIASLSELLQNQAYAPFHEVGKEVRGLLVGAITFANESSTSLSSANEILDTSLNVFSQACTSIADKFELSTESTSSLVEFKRCERERQELLKRASVDGAEAKQEEGLRHLEEAIESAKRDASRVLERQRREDEAQILSQFKDKKDDMETLVNNEISELNIMSDNCESDVQKTDKSLDFLAQSAEAAFNKYTETDKELCLRLQGNRAEQDELRRRLLALQALESQMEDERTARKNTQDKAEETEQRAREDLSNWKKQIEELFNGCQAALTVMWQFKEGSSKLIDSSISSKIEEEQRLHELDIMAQRTLRDSLAAATVEAQHTLDISVQNVNMLRQRIKEKKEELSKASRQGLSIFVEEIKRDLSKYKESYNNFQRQKVESEGKLKTYKEQMALSDERLQGLGEQVESFDDIYAKFQKEKEAIWDTPDDSSLNSVEDF